MVNVYEKSGFKNPSIPKPAGGYSSTVKPASAPMRQGGLSQLAAKAAMQGRQPSVGNPPVPDTGRGVFQSRAYEAPPPQDRSQELPGGYRPSLTPQVTPQRGGMIGALGQQRIAPQGQSRGMLAAAAEAPPRTPYTAPVVQIPGAGIDYAQGLADFYTRGAAKPGGRAEKTEDERAREAARAMKELWRGMGGEVDEDEWGSWYDANYRGLTPEQHQQKKMLEGWGKAGKDALPYDWEGQQIANEKASLIAGGMSPQMADLYMELDKGEYGQSDEELAKQISKGAGIQSEMMAGIGLGASGLAGTGFGDIYSQVLSDNEQLALQEKMGTQNLMAQLLTSEANRKAVSAATEEQEKKEFLGEWSVFAGGKKVHPKAEQTYYKLKELGYSDMDIKAMGWTQGGQYNIALPVEEFPEDLVAQFGPPPDDFDEREDWKEKIKKALNTTKEQINLWLDKWLSEGNEYGQQYAVMKSS